MLNNPQALLDALRQNWEPAEGSVFSYEEVEERFSFVLSVLLDDLDQEAIYRKKEQWRRTLHTVPTEFEKLSADILHDATNRAVAELLKGAANVQDTLALGIGKYFHMVRDSDNALRQVRGVSCVHKPSTSQGESDVPS